MKEEEPFVECDAYEFLIDTIQWTTEEVGAYFRLRMHECVAGKFTDINSPETQVILAGLCKYRDSDGLQKWETIWNTIGYKFEREEY